MSDYDVVILGGGAAGLMCANVVAARGRRVVVLEGSNKVGKKILMSGGGRCNFTNTQCSPRHFISANPGFAISALSRYTPADFVSQVEKHEIPYHEKTAGQLFCDRSSRDILDMLISGCEREDVTIVTHCAVSSVAHNDQYATVTDQGTFLSDTLVVATGGLSIPKMGASDFGYRIGRQFGHRVRPTSAALVPFTFSGALRDMFVRLSGVSLRAEVSAGGESFTESILFTHRGLSGPAILQLSSYWSPGADIGINLLPGLDGGEYLIDAKSRQSQAVLRSVLSAALPRALVLECQNLFWSGEAEMPLREIANDRLRQIGAQLNDWCIRPAGTEGYRTAEVTLGGIDTDELSSKTMESRLCPGLYFIGEVVDVTGQLGGFNFQWAWASAQAAGRAI